ncbi:MAG: GDYXXLXY domain-containing protein [Candidatus Omnitrophica bacterium]|nr:GDYXXLXY domain-containing protein [Candidatus Omnitrophota bacterium]
MKNRLIVGLFLAVCLIQVVTPLSMIIKRENTLNNGQQFKFKTAPVDPYDAFRGRYVALRIENDYLPVADQKEFIKGQTVYALINVDDQGFAAFTAAVTQRPKGKPYIKAKVRYVSQGKVYLDLPIDRYYMEEKATPAAERVYRQRSRRNKQDAYVIVKIKDGFAVIEGLYIAGQRIEDAVKQDIEK